MPKNTLSPYKAISHEKHHIAKVSDPAIWHLLVESERCPYARGKASESLHPWAQKLRISKEQDRKQETHSLSFPKGLQCPCLKGKMHQGMKSASWVKRTCLTFAKPNNDKRTDGSTVAFSSLALQRKETREIRWNQETQQLSWKLETAVGKRLSIPRRTPTRVRKLL